MHASFPARFFGFLFVTVIGSLPAQVPNPGSEGRIQLAWLSDYQQALSRAEKEKKPVLIDVTTDWCGWSKKMERESFADLTIQKELRSFVLVRINPEASEKNEKIAEGYGADSYPTLVVANYRGEQLGSQSGYMASKELLEFLRRHLPLFKGNPLGYKSVQLAPGDPLLKAVKRIPPPESRPTTVGSFTVLDQCDIRLQADGTAKYITRIAIFVADPDKGDLPQALRNYVSSREKAKFTTVRILNTRGEGREIDVRLAKDEHAYSNQNVYWDVRTLSIDLPALKEGQIVDMIEERESQPIVPGQFFYRWNTGRHILLHSDLTITFPSAMNLQQRSVRCAGTVKETRNVDGTVTWELITSNPTAPEPVLFAPPYAENWEGYEFYTSCPPEAMARWYAGLCEGREELPESAKRRVAELKQASTTQTALLQDILDWVTKDIRYVSVAFGASSHQPHTVRDTLSNLYGDCKDQSLLVKALCGKAGIPCSLVLLNVYGPAFDERNPAVDQFNHCIVEATADGHKYYLDASSGRAKLGRIPEYYAGNPALRLEGSAASAITLPAYQPRTEGLKQTLVKLNPNGSATVTESSQYTGDQAIQAKERMKGTTVQKVRKYLEDAYKRNGRKLIDFYMTNPGDAEDKYESRITYTVPRYGSRTAGGLVFKLGEQGEAEDWVASLNAPRTEPFRFRAGDITAETYTVELPARARLKSRPEDLEIDTAFLRASRKISFSNNKLSVSETSGLRAARLEAREAGKVYETFRKLHDHRGYAFIMEMPAASESTGE